MKSPRIDYVDAIKGFSILWVVLFHFDNVVPQWVAVPYRMPLFFFMSGMFFRLKPFKEFFIRRINTLVIPLVIWLLFSWLFLVFKYEFLQNLLGMKLGTTDYGWHSITNILDFFNMQRTNYYESFYLNGPLWFLIGLFLNQMIYYAMRKVTDNKWLLLIMCAILYYIGYVLKENDYHGCYILSLALLNITYYAFGSMFGSQLMEAIKSQTNQWLVIFIGVPVLVILPFVNTQIMTFDIGILLRTICFITVIFVIFSHISKFKICKPLKYFGQNSIVLLVTHYIIIIGVIYPIDRTIFNSQMMSKYYIFVFLILCVIEYLLIKFCNKYIPWAIGKKDLIKIK